MNSLDDILSQKADDLFKDTPQKTTTPTVADEKTATSQELDINKLKSLVYGLKDQVEGILRLLNAEQGKLTINNYPNETQILNTGEKIVEGIFNGEKMIGADGLEYSIPPNYASKSKLVEGDMMKLTITNNGSFVFKQIGPIERKRLVGELVSSPEGQWSTLADGKTYKILTASITFYKAKAGDEVVILVPQEGTSEWAAVDNVIHKT